MFYVGSTKNLAFSLNYAMPFYCLCTLTQYVHGIATCVYVTMVALDWHVKWMNDSTTVKGTEYSTE